jgi:hypothetical protein
MLSPIALPVGFSELNDENVHFLTAAVSDQTGTGPDVEMEWSNIALPLEKSSAQILLRKEC